MKTVIRKSLSWILSVMMIVGIFALPLTVSAYDKVDGFPDFDPDLFAADMMTSDDSPTKTYQTIKNFLSYESPASTMSESIRNNTDLLVSIESWRALTFDPSDSLEKNIDETDYYECIVLSALESYSSSSILKKTIDNEVIKTSKSIFKSFKNALELEYGVEFVNDISADELAKIPSEKLSECFEKEFKKTYPKINGAGKFIKNFSEFVKAGESLEKTINSWAAYFHCSQMEDSFKQMVNDLYDKCDGVKNHNLKYALYKIKEACASFDSAFCVNLYNTMENTAYDIYGKIMDEVFDGIVAANPALYALSKGRDFGKGVSNLLFNTDDIASKCYDLMSFSEFEVLMKDLLNQYINDYKAVPDNENASRLFAAIDSAYANFGKGCDEAADLCNLLKNSNFNRIVSVFSNKNDYDEAIRVIAAQKKQNELDHKNVRENDYNTALEIEWPEIYDEYKKQDQSSESQSSGGQETSSGGGSTSVSPTTIGEQKSGCIYFYRPSDWGYDIHIYIYDFYKDGPIGPNWPGYSMTYIGGNTYKFEYYSNDPAIRIMFNDGYTIERDLKGDCHQVPGKCLEGFHLVNYSFYEVSETQSASDSSEFGRLEPYVSPSFIIDRLNHPLYGANISSEEINVGDKITVRAAGEGGSGSYTYSYYSKKNTDTDWTPIAEDTSLSSVDFTPTETADYEIKITIKDSEGSSADSTYTFNVIDAPQLNNTSVIDKDTFCVGEKVCISAGATNGTAPFEYAYYYKKSDNFIWSEILNENGSEYVTSDKAEFNPTSSGTYNLRVNVKDSNGKIGTKEFTVIVSEKISAPVNKTTVSKTSFNVGEIVSVTGAASGGTAPYTYEFYYKRSTASGWTRFGKDGRASFKPGSAGSFIIRTYVKDSTGRSVRKDFELTASAAVLENKTTVSKTSFNVGEIVTVTGAASGGTAPYTYEFYYKRSTASGWTRFGKDGRASFKPGSAGSFIIRTYVKDGTSAKVKDFNLTAVSALENKTTVSKTSFNVGEIVTVTGAASGGTGPYTYQFYYQRSGASSWTRFGSADMGRFCPGSAGTFTIRTYAKDSTGRAVKKDFTLTAK